MSAWVAVPLRCRMVSVQVRLLFFPATMSFPVSVPLAPVASFSEAIAFVLRLAFNTYVVDPLDRARAPTTPASNATATAMAETRTTFLRNISPPHLRRFSINSPHDLRPRSRLLVDDDGTAARAADRLLHGAPAGDSSVVDPVIREVQRTVLARQHGEADRVAWGDRLSAGGSGRSISVMGVHPQGDVAVDARHGP